MFAEFENYIKTQAGLSEEEVRLVISSAVGKFVRRKEVLLQEGEICRYKLFVCKGLLRMYRTGAEGNEHVMQFSPELSWTTEAESYNNQTPSAYSIEALEDSTVLMWRKGDFAELFSRIPALKAFSDRIITENLYLTRNRIFNAISSTPEEKYEDFIRSYPGMLLRVPLRMVASYLGVSVKTLTRIRQAQLQR